MSTEIAKRLNNSNGYTCPFCRSEVSDDDRGQYEMNYGNILSIICTCRNCRASWIEEYKLNKAYSINSDFDCERTDEYTDTFGVILRNIKSKELFTSIDKAKELTGKFFKLHYNPSDDDETWFNKLETFIEEEL